MAVVTRTITLIYFTFTIQSVWSCWSRGNPKPKDANSTDTASEDSSSEFDDTTSIWNSFDEWPFMNRPAMSIEDVSPIWTEAGGPGGEDASDDGKGGGWGFGKYQGDDDDGPFRDEYGNIIPTDKYGLPIGGFGHGTDPRWGDDLGYPYVGHKPPPYALLPKTSMDVPAACLEPPYFGLCYQTILRYGYNPYLNRCLPYRYSGCGGSNNRFMTRQRCQEACLQRDIDCDADTALDIDNLVVK